MPLYLWEVIECFIVYRDREPRKETCSSLFNGIMISKYNTLMIAVKCKRLSQMMMF